MQYLSSTSHGDTHIHATSERERGREREREREGEGEGGRGRAWEWGTMGIHNDEGRARPVTERAVLGVR